MQKLIIFGLITMSFAACKHGSKAEMASTRERNPAQTGDIGTMAHRRPVSDELKNKISLKPKGALNSEKKAELTSLVNQYVSPHIRKQVTRLIEQAPLSDYLIKDGRLIVKIDNTNLHLLRYRDIDDVENMDDIEYKDTRISNVKPKIVFDDTLPLKENLFIPFGNSSDIRIDPNDKKMVWTKEFYSWAKSQKGFLYPGNMYNPEDYLTVFSDPSLNKCFFMEARVFKNETNWVYMNTTFCAEGSSFDDQNKNWTQLGLNFCSETVCGGSRGGSFILFNDKK